MYTTDCILIKDIRPGLKNISCTFIVLEVGNATVTKENKEVRTFKVADQSACINVSIWGEPGSLLYPGDIVRLTKGYAVIWRQCLTLYSGKNGDIHKLGDFCMLFNEQLNMSEPNPHYGPQQQQQQGGAGQQGQQQQNGANPMINGNNNGRGGPPGFNGNPAINLNSNNPAPAAQSSSSSSSSSSSKATRLSNENKGGGSSAGPKGNRGGRSSNSSRSNVK